MNTLDGCSHPIWMPSAQLHIPTQSDWPVQAIKDISPLDHNTAEALQHLPSTMLLAHLEKKEFQSLQIRQDIIVCNSRSVQN